MNRRAISKPSGEAPAVVTWGYFSVLLLPDDSPRRLSRSASMNQAIRDARGASTEGIPTAFWAAWWTEDPRVKPNAAPDDLGIVTGPRAHTEAVSIADHAIRMSKSWRVYARSIGEGFAAKALRSGVKRQTSAVVTGRRDGLRALEILGLDAATATAEDVRHAYRTAVVAPGVHPDKGGTREKLQRFIDAKALALDHIKLRDQDTDGAARERGEKVAPRPKGARARKTSAETTPR